jgi:hypothetical protein
MPNPLHECEFYAERNDKGLLVGRCREWPDLRTKPYRVSLDAIDDIVDQVREKLRAIHATQPDRNEAR